LSNSTVYSIIQDSKGFIWFATEDGLNKYDGYKFTIYHHDLNDPNSLSGNYIYTIIEDHKGNLWIGTDRWFDLYDRNSNSFIHFYPENKENQNISSVVKVKALCEDHQGNLWIGTDGDGLFSLDPKSGNFTQYKYNKDNKNSLSSNSIKTLFEDSKGRLWIGTELDGLNLFDQKKKQFIHYRNNPGDKTTISDNAIHCIYEDRKGTLWIGTQYGGLNQMLKEAGTFTCFKNNPNNKNSISSNFVYVIFEDGKGNLWIGTDNGGLNQYDRQKGVFYHFIHDNLNKYSLSTNTIRSIYEDRQGNFWIGGLQSGVNFFTTSAKAFAHYKNDPVDKNSLSHNSVLAIIKDRQGNLWIGTDGGGLNLFNRANNTFIHYKNNPKDKNSLGHNAVLTVYEDKKANLWAGSFLGGVSRFNKQDGSFINYKNNPKDPYSLSFNDVRCIFEDSRDNLWIVTCGGGVNLFDRQSQKFHHYSIDDLKPEAGLVSKYCLLIYEDSQGMLWIGTYDGLSMFDPDKGKFTNYSHDETNPYSLSHNWVYSVLEDRKGNLWIGTAGGLNLFNREKKGFSYYTKRDGLPNNVINGILEDNKGNLWISTNKGLSQFNPQTKICKNYNVSDGLQSDEFIHGAYFKSPEGEMFFGGINGFNSFFPDSIKGNRFIPPVVITDFNIFNKRVPIGGKGSPLQKHISETDKITISYKQSVLDFKWAALNYENPGKNLYAYMMQGFDKEWNYTGNKRSATYTNLDPGEYIFNVKGSNNDGIWNEQGTSIKIIITPPFWKTWWFRILLFMTIIMTIITVHKIRVRNIEDQRRELEIKVEERTHELKEANQEINEKANALELAKKETDNILHNVEEGFFILNNEYHVSSQYSSILESIFSRKKLAQLNLIDFLRDKIKPGEVENTKTYLDLLFQENIKEESIEDLNPLVDIEFTLYKGDSKISKYLDFGFKRIKEKEDKEIELIATVRDVTEQVLLAKRLKEEEARRERLLQLILGILNVEPEMLHEFNESAQRELDFIDSILNATKIDDYEALLIKMYRATHLIKGNARLLNIDYFAQAAHQFEDMISEVQKKNRIDEKDLEPLRAKLFELQTGIEEMEKIIERLGKVLTHKKGKRKTDTRSLLRSLENLINSFSSDLGKKIKFSYKNFKHNLIPKRYHLLVKEVLIQLVRNSISHGIETPEERKRLRKPAVGKIEIATFKKDGNIGFRLKDDGRGIQIEKLKENAIKSGKWKKEQLDEWNDQQIAELIFTSGITTSDKVDMVAGRGVGMDSVRNRVKEHHGEIHICFARNKYCEFEVILPLTA
jgi:ligand-binding sensor domain-containing protein/HPt (histidine-containing phosphotransfer) domain-containing protein